MTGFDSTRHPRGHPGNRGQFRAKDRGESVTELTAHEQQTPIRDDATVSDIDQGVNEWRRDHPKHPLVNNQNAVNKRINEIAEANAAGTQPPPPRWEPPHGPERDANTEAFLAARAGESTPRMAQYLLAQIRNSESSGRI